MRGCCAKVGGCAVTCSFHGWWQMMVTGPPPTSILEERRKEENGRGDGKEGTNLLHAKQHVPSFLAISSPIIHLPSHLLCHVPPPFSPPPPWYF